MYRKYWVFGAALEIAKGHVKVLMNQTIPIFINFQNTKNHLSGAII